VTRRGLIVVRNGVTHDARILREAATMAEASLDPLIVGVQTTTERRRRSIEGGFPVLRLDPMAPGRRLLRRLGRGPGAAAAPDLGGSASAPSPPSSPNRTAPAPAPGPRARMRRSLLALDFTRQAVGVVRRTRPAVVHCNDHNSMWVGVAARLLTGARVIYDSHELWPDRNGRPEWRPGLLATEALFVRAAHEVVTTSPGYADVLAERYRVPRPPLVRNGPAGAPTAAADADLDPPRAVYVGGLMRGRGLEEALDALPLVDGLTLRFVGPGRPEYRRTLEERARALGVAGRLELRDAVAPGEVVAQLRGAVAGLCLIQPVCLSYRLTLPNKLFEYAAAAVPMVASDLPVIARTIRDSRSGLLVAPGDVEGIAAALRALLDPDFRRSYAEGAEALGRTVTWDAERTRLAALYRRPAAGWAPAPGASP
jgi:glycosyltransferase involved in cell wall biosynthesis